MKELVEVVRGFSSESLVKAKIFLPECGETSSLREMRMERLLEEKMRVMLVMKKWRRKEMFDSPWGLICTQQCQLFETEATTWQVQMAGT